ncbi:MAG: hypothetical protein ACOYI2_03565 [Bacillota bacterium]|jgi:hypothetical protein
MESIDVITAIRAKFNEVGSPALIQMSKTDRYFKAELAKEGVYVDNLREDQFLPWAVFTETVALLKQKGGRAIKGNAVDFKLGEIGLSVESIEGHIARVVYGMETGERVFRRIISFGNILIWAGVCLHEPGELVLCEMKLEGK